MSSLEVGEEEINEAFSKPIRKINVRIQMHGHPPVGQQIGKSRATPDWSLIMMFNGYVSVNVKWDSTETVEVERTLKMQPTYREVLADPDQGLFDLRYDLLDPNIQQIIADNPMIFLMRCSGGKQSKDPDPLASPDNRGGGTVDLLPLALGAPEVAAEVRLVSTLGEPLGCSLRVLLTASGPDICQPLVPLVLTMASVSCLPPVQKLDTVFLASIGLGDPVNKTVNFNMTVSNNMATKALWAGACTGGPMMNSAYPVPDQDVYIPPGFELLTNENCITYYWNTVRRVLVSPEGLRKILSVPIPVEVAGVPRMSGKSEVRARYMGIIDPGALLEKDMITVLVSARLQNYIEQDLPEDYRPLFDFPPASAKSTKGSPLICADLQGHFPYIKLQFDIPEPLVAKPHITKYFEIIRFPPPEKRVPLDELYIEHPPEDLSVDARKIRKECGALAVHKELSNMSCRGLVPMTQGIKKTAANRLLTRVRTMLKQFSPGECSYLEWQETVTGQHAASRRAVTASFRPQPPPPHRHTPHPTVARARMADDQHLAEFHIENNLKYAGHHPRNQLCKTLRLLEERTESQAKIHLCNAIRSQTRNRYLLWTFGAMEFDKGRDRYIEARAAFRIAVKGDKSDGPACTIGWAALHALDHYGGNPYGAFKSAKLMRKSHELPRDWTDFYGRWVETSGEEEFVWAPEIIKTDNPLLMAAAFFLCLRSYKFADVLIECSEAGCSVRGSRFGLQNIVTADDYYVKAASMLLRRRVLEASTITEAGVRRFGPDPMLLQMRADCLMAERGWDGECESALADAERAGAVLRGAILLRAALNGMKREPRCALQRATRVHRQQPCPHSALGIARVLARLGDAAAAEGWASAAVRLEPRLADGWAVLAQFALTDGDQVRARALLRTARQAGVVSEPIERQLQKLLKAVKIEELADTISDGVCFCDKVEYVEVPEATRFD